MQTRQYDLAIARLEQFLVLDRTSTDGHYWLGVAYEGKGEMEKATSEYHEALKFNPRHREALQALARLGR